MSEQHAIAGVTRVRGNPVKDFLTRVLISFNVLQEATVGLDEHAGHPDFSVVSAGRLDELAQTWVITRNRSPHFSSKRSSSRRAARRRWRCRSA
jgi:hypothetical protein